MDDLLENGASGFTRGLSSAVISDAAELDQLIDRHAIGWDVTRLAPLDRAILRVAVAEIREPERFDSRTPIPAEGAVDEAVETAKLFCSVDAPAFINGILGSVVEEKRNTP